MATGGTVMTATRGERPARALALLTAVAVTATVVTARPPAAAASDRFTDVPAGHAAHDAVAWLAGEDIAAGVTSTTFSPSAAVTRGQMASFLWRYNDRPGDGDGRSFTDVTADAHYASAVGWLATNGITTGTTETTFSPGATVTRGQMALFLWRMSGRPAPEGEPTAFDDVDPDGHLGEAVGWLSTSGVTSGATATEYRPRRAVTRGQMALFLWRLAGQPTAGTPGVNRVGDAVVVLDGDEVSQVVLDADGGTLMVPPSSELSSGSGLVVAPGTGLLDGLVARVVAVEETATGDRLTVVRTSVDEVIPDLDFRGRIDTPSSAPGTAGTMQAFATASWEWEGCEATPLTLDPLRFSDGEVVVEFSGGPFREDRLEVVWRPVVHIGAELHTGSFECTGTVRGRDWRLGALAIGPVPVVFTLSPKAEVTVAVEAGVALRIDQAVQLEVGFRYLDGKVTPLHATQNLTVTPELEAPAGTVELWMGPTVRAAVAGVAGVELGAGPALELTAGAVNPCWKLDGMLRMGASAFLDVWFFEEVDWTFAQVDLLRSRWAASTRSCAGGTMDWRGTIDHSTRDTQHTYDHPLTLEATFTIADAPPVEAWSGADFREEWYRASYTVRATASQTSRSTEGNRTCTYTEEIDHDSTHTDGLVMVWFKDEETTTTTGETYPSMWTMMAEGSVELTKTTSWVCEDGSSGSWEDSFIRDLHGGVPEVPGGPDLTRISVTDSWDPGVEGEYEISTWELVRTGS